jgi:hypothetical protein
MQLRMWTYDLAREQAPSLEHMRIFCDATVAGGYNAIGLYLEHRFAYPSTPWAHGRDCLTPEIVAQLQEEYPQIQIVPFVNLLGHFEGMIYTEFGKRFREERFQGMQACPCNPEFLQLCHAIIADTIAIFKSEIIHLGGDETWQLGQCSNCKSRIADASNTQHPIPNTSPVDGKAVLYGEHFGPLARYVQEKGRRPAVWGDMYIEHPIALDYMPKGTLIFDWQYFDSPLETSRTFREKGFDVVCCPTLQTYNAAWFHLEQSEKNVADAVEAVRALDAHGVCVTTWECALFGNYETLLPAIEASGRVLAAPDTNVDVDFTVGNPGALQNDPDLTPLNESPNLVAQASSLSSGNGPYATNFLDAYCRESDRHADWARLMAVELQSLGGVFAHSQTRSSLKVRLLLEANPFLAWLYHHEELTGEIGDKGLEIVERAISVAPSASYRGVSEFVKSAILFVRFADQARQAYANGLPGVATSALAPCRQLFENLEKVARASHLNIGGSLADIERCRVAREHVERIIKRIRDYGDGSLGYLPAFEHITHPKFVPHDQAAWWLINRWANE